MPARVAMRVIIAFMTTATFDTSEGTFKVKLYDDKAPSTVANFVGLAEGSKEWTDPKTGDKVKRPFYDGLVFHRVIDGFMIQGGCPTGNGMGGPGYKFADEFGGLDAQRGWESITQRALESATHIAARLVHGETIG